MIPFRPMLPPTITDTAQVEEIAAAIGRAGSFALDLEFMSESRYIPDLALVQVGWGAVEEPEVAAIDPLEVELESLLRWVEDEDTLTLFHAGQGDLSLLADLFGAEARCIFDTQIGAAFLGLGDQLGYAALVGEILDVPIDKGMQFTRWLDRPLSEEQLRYALDDVRYLPAVAAELIRRLREKGRLGWAEEECRILAATAGERLEPAEVYRKIGGWKRLKPRQLGALKELAQWREERALRSNRPPSWIVKNKALLDLARRLPRSMEELEKITDLPEKSRARHGKDLLRGVRRGNANPVTGGPSSAPPPEARKLGGKLSARIQEHSREAEIAPRFVGSRADADRLAVWWVTGDRTREPELPLLQGWRRELAGEAVLEWLRKR